MSAILSLLRYSLRLLLKSPGFTITAIVILGCSIGMSTAIFSLIDAVILRPLPFPNSERLVQICDPTKTTLSVSSTILTTSIWSRHNTHSSF
jgi:putative ABC transport system permease protein